MSHCRPVLESLFEIGKSEVRARVEVVSRVQPRLESRLSELEILQTFAVDMLRSRNLDDLLWSIAEDVGQLLAFEDFVLYLREDDCLYQRAAYGNKNPDRRAIKNPIVIEVGEGIVGTVAQTGCAELLSDVTKDVRYIADEIAGRSELSVPVVYQQRVIGVFDAESTQPNGFTEVELRVLQTLANISAPRIVSAQAEAQREKNEETLKRSAQKQAEKALWRSEEQYRTLMEKMPDPAVVTLPDGESRHPHLIPRGYEARR